jgi:hypothetical protein
MPCEDQTEYLELLLDEEDRLEDFLLRKKTCGRAVGDTSLQPYVKGMSLEELLGQELEQKVPHLHELELTDEFLMFKQYYSLRAAAAVILGLETGSLAEPFVMDEMIISADKAKYAGYVSVDVISEEIEACGKCRGCATRRRKSA